MYPGVSPRTRHATSKARGDTPGCKVLGTFVGSKVRAPRDRSLKRDVSDITMISYMYVCV